MATISSFPITADAVSALPAIGGTINTTDKFPFNSGSTTSYCTFQQIINNLATTYQALNSNLTSVSNASAPTASGLSLLALTPPSANSYIQILSSGSIVRRSYAQVLSDIAAQPASLSLTALSVLDPATTAGKNILLIANPSTAGYVNVGAAGASAQVDNYNTVAGHIRGYIIPPVETKASSATTTWAIDYSTSDFWTLTAQAGNIIVGNPGGSPTTGSVLTLRITDSGSRRNLNFIAAGSKYRGTSGAALPTATQASTLYLRFLYNADDDKWDCILNTYTS